MSNTEYDLNHHTHKKSHHAGNKITYPSNTRTFTSNDAFLNHQRVNTIRMGVVSFLAYQNGECFVIYRRYKATLPTSSKFTVTKPIKSQHGLFADSPA